MQTTLPGAAEALSAEENMQLNHREYQQNRVVLESFPYHIQIGADNRCNLKCGFCLAAADREKGLLHIQDRKLERNPIQIFQLLAPYMRYWKYLSLTGPGESLLNPKLRQILQLIRLHSDCTLVITTNGVLIDEVMADMFVECRVDEISISLDSLRKEVYEELRVNARLEDALAGIDRLVQARQAKASDIPRVNLTPNFMTVNIEELPNFVDFAAQKGIHAVQATPTQIYRRSWVDRSLLHHPELTRRMARQAEQKAQQTGVHFSNGLKMVYQGRKGGRLPWRRRSEVAEFPTDPSECQKPWASLYIEPDGEVRPCCYQSPIYGNIFEAGFEALWNGPQAIQLRQEMVDGAPPQPCRECYEYNRHDPSIMIQV